MLYDMKELELVYFGLIDKKIDIHLREELPKILKEDFDIDMEWYFQECTLSEPYYRNMGFEIKGELTELQRVCIAHTISSLYNDDILIIKL